MDGVLTRGLDGRGTDTETSGTMSNEDVSMHGNVDSLTRKHELGSFTLKTK